jgi:hypothetical protein
MDASKITQLRQQQANIYINRAQQSVDASLMTWQRQIQSSRYIPQVTTTASTLGGCATCGGMAQVNISQNTQVAYPNPLSSAKGSGSFIPSSDAITYKRAGDQFCGATNVTGSTSLEQQFIELPKCYCTSQNNPYLPIPKPYVAFTEPSPCTACAHYKVIIDGREVVSTRIDRECPSCFRRATDPSVLP